MLQYYFCAAFGKIAETTPVHTAPHTSGHNSFALNPFATMADKNDTVWVVTGANRGIGLEFIVQVTYYSACELLMQFCPGLHLYRSILHGAQILAMPDTSVVAGVRTPEKAIDLQKLADKHGDRLHIVKLDLANIETITVSGVLLLGLSPTTLTTRVCGRLGTYSVQTGIKLTVPNRLP